MLGPFQVRENVSPISENSTVIHRRNNEARTMARGRRNGGRIAGIVMIITAVFLAGGCGSPPPDADVTVKVKLAAKQIVGLWCVSGGSDEDIFAVIRTKRAEDSAEKTLEFVIPPGSLLCAAAPGPKGGSKILGFPYLYDGAEKQPLVFSRSGFQGTVNGKPVHLDLTTSEAIAWFAKQPASATKAIRSIRLSGNSPNDARALSRFANSGIIVWFDFEKGFETVKDPKLVRALIAAKPSGLFAPGGKNLDKLLADLPDLEYLCSGGKRIPNLVPLRKLKFFGFGFNEGSPGSLAPLADAAGLQGLCLVDCEATTDFKPIRKHGDLRRLFLVAPKIEDLSALSGLKKLRRLVLASKNLKDISGVRGLQSLREAAFIPVPNTVKDLTPLKDLKGLKMLIVDKETLEKRKAEYDEVRKALPDTEIVGFCMGSAWILIPVLAVVFGWLLHRRKRAASGRL